MRLLLAACACLLLTACGGRVVEAGDVTVLVGQRSGSGMDALGGGVLEVVGGCLGAGDHVVVWPHGTEVVDEDPLTIDVPGEGEGEVSLGDEISLAGGYVDESDGGAGTQSGPVQVGGVRVPEACVGRGVFLSHVG
jgi:hypothetical protein